jgi:hypothetical protein
MHNHLGGSKVAPTIAGLKIEDGQGHQPVEIQLAEHAQRIWATQGADALRDLYVRILLADGYDIETFKRELEARNLKGPDHAPPSPVAAALAAYRFSGRPH